MAWKKPTAVAYYRTSSAANVGTDKDSQRRQAEMVESYAKSRHVLVDAFYDAAVSGADPVDTRPGFGRLLAYCEAHGVAVVLVENASRFARDLAVQLTGHALLRARGIELVPVDAPTYCTDPSPTAELVRQILGAVSQFEKAGLVAKLRHAREAKRASAGRCEGRKPVPEAAEVEARRLARRSPKTGKRRSLRAVAAELASLGYFGPTGAPYHAGSVRHMLGAASPRWYIVHHTSEARDA
jgi:DNA invertase Pin-like site-specific DNA recombinase